MATAWVIRRVLAFVLLGNAISCSLLAGVLIAPGATWRYQKGFAEASSPDRTAWRQWDFPDGGWGPGAAAFYYENQPGSANAYTGNTPLSDMDGGYTCIFLRRAFVITNIYDFERLELSAYSDDGFVAW
ncbi:MAG: hypothetical protein EHM35_17390, partial [Planctomycetaceae bacterium]